MYTWYAKSDVCIAYLGDITHGQHELQSSEWFKRGWTLQELIAPDRVDFYDSQWKLLGDKKSLAALISERTRIPATVLSKKLDIQKCSIAQRLSWAAGRKTTEPEDRAYSLVGLFDISCVVQYGEGGDNAFLNLQKEIIKEFSDESIFAWRWPTNSVQDSTTSGLECHGMLASSPDWFEACGDFVPLSHASQFTYANGILSLNLPTRPHSLEAYLALLSVTNGKGRGQVGLLLARLSTEGEYIRVRDPNTLTTEEWNYSYKIREIAVRQRVTEVPQNFFQGFWLRQLYQRSSRRVEPTVSSKGWFDANDRIKLSPESYGTAGVVCMLTRKQAYGSRGWPRVCWLKFGFDESFNPVCMVANSLVREQSEIGLNPDLFHESLSLNDTGERDNLHIFREDWLSSREQIIPTENASRERFFVLKGHRTRRLFTHIKNIDLSIQISLSKLPLPSSMVNENPQQQQSVWTVDVVSEAIERKTAAERVKAWWIWTRCCLRHYLDCACRYHNLEI